MSVFYKKLTFLNLFICLFFSGLVTQIYAEDDICHHCNSPAHKSDEEPCLLCGRLVKNCDYFHTVKSLTCDDILNAPDSKTLSDILFRIRDMYKSKKGRILSFHDVFQKASDAFREKGIALPEKGLREMKEALKRRDHYQNYLNYCLKNIFYEGFEESPEYQCMIAVAKNLDSSDEVKYPEKLRYGIMLTWCGAAVSILSDGLLSPFGGIIISIGTTWTLEGTLEYNQNKQQYEKEVAEKAKLKAEKDAKKAEKVAREKAEKDERRRQKEERRKIKEEQKK